MCGYLPVNHLQVDKNCNYMPCILANYSQINQANFPDNESLDSDYLKNLEKINLLR